MNTSSRLMYVGSCNLEALNAEQLTEKMAEVVG